MKKIIPFLVLLTVFPAATLAAGQFSASVPELSGRTGTKIAVPVSVKNSGSDMANIIVDVEIYDSGNRQVLQKYFEYQYFGYQETKSYSVDWTPKKEGQYFVHVGIFGEHWNPTHLWAGNVGKISVSNTVVSEPQPAPVPAPTPAPPTLNPVSSTLEIWWPVQNVSLSGVQPLKALVKELPVTAYQLYWQVDGDRLNFIPNNYDGTPHKEVLVDFTNWNWKGSGPYVLNFVAKDNSGNKIAERAVSIYTGTFQMPQTQTQTAPLALQTTQTISSPALSTSQTTVTGNPFAGTKLYVNPYSDPKRWADGRRSWDPYNVSLMDRIANQSETQWFGNWNSNIYEDVRKMTDTITAQGALPVFVVYNIPQRDCGGYSAGGLGSPDAYRSWIRSVADAIGSRRAVVIVEPDALAGMDCLSSWDRDIRLQLLRETVDLLNTKENISVYIDAGHARWKTPEDMAGRLKQAGVEKARGFSLNISNFITNSESVAYGEKVSALVGGKPFVVETSRNGLGPSPDNQWCNPPGRALGVPPAVNTGHHLVDAYLWVKGPSGSDGQCNGGPVAGIFWPEYGLGLSQRASW